MRRYKARDIMRNEAYFLYAAVTNGERNAVMRIFQQPGSSERIRSSRNTRSSPRSKQWARMPV